MSARFNCANAKRIVSLYEDLFYCPSCSIWRICRPTSTGRPILRRRRASSLASSTAVNATKAIPPPNKPLHDALSQLKKKAFAQVNLSRLQLALQGLESESPTTRVAVLSLYVSTTARRLVRLLLADALNADESWEKQLHSDHEDYTEGLLIRYGDPQDSSLQQPKYGLSTLLIPASVLQRNNIEILVSSINVPTVPGVRGNDVSTSSDAFLSPAVSTPSSSSGRLSRINQPVHKSLIIAKNIDELIGIAELMSSSKFSSASEAKMVDVAVNLEGDFENELGRTALVNLKKAEEGLEAIRSSLSKATTYEHKWLESGMPGLSKWLALASANGTSILSKPVRNLITSLLDGASSNIKSQAIESARSAEHRRISSNTRATLEQAITEFSYQAHAELQSGLAAAWSSRNWRKLAWYKLFWRVDDVSLIVTDLISNAWLPQSEKSVYELSGRLLQAGIPPSGFEEAPTEVKVVAAEEPVSTAEFNTILGAPASVRDFGTAQIVPIPGQTNVVLQQTQPNPAALASTISTARRRYMSSAIADMSFSAQEIVLKTLSISGLSAGLSSLAYFSITSGSVYESATVVALGTAYALRRMQGDWQAQCKLLEDGLLDAGRTVLRQTEDRMRQLVIDGGREAEDEVDVTVRGEAAAAVETARQELRKLSP